MKTIFGKEGFTVRTLHHQVMCTTVKKPHNYRVHGQKSKEGRGFRQCRPTPDDDGGVAAVVLKLWLFFSLTTVHAGY